MKQTIILLWLAAAAFLPGAAAGQQRKARVAVPPLKEIVKEAFTKEFGMKLAGQKFVPPVTHAYNALAKSSILDKMESKVHPDTLYIMFDIPSDGECPPVQVWRAQQNAYVVAEHGSMSDIDINGYYVIDLNQSPHRVEILDTRLAPIIYSWDVATFHKHIGSERLIGLNALYVLRIIRNRDGYSYNGMYEAYANNPYKTGKQR